MTLRTEKFKPHDFAKMEPADNQLVAAEWSRKPHYIASLLKSPGWTVWDDDTPVAMFGYRINWPGTATAWCLLGNELGAKCLLRISRHIKIMLGEAMAAHGVWRVDTTVEQGFHAGVTWAIMLGFEIEGPLRKYGADGKDHWMMARIT